MSDGRRPGGLTALAVLNFMFGAWGLLGVVAFLGAMRRGSHNELGTGLWMIPRGAGAMPWAQMTLGLLTSVALLVSGAGYLGQKRFMGRTVGNAYAVLSLAATFLALTYARFGVGTLIGLVYPVLTLILINTTFRHDLVSLSLPQGRSASRESTLTGLHADHVALVARYGVRFAIRTGSGLATLLAVLIVGLSVASIVFSPVEELVGMSPEDTGDAIGADGMAQSRRVARLVRDSTDTPGPQVDYLVRENPALLSATFLMLLWILPFLTCLSASNQTSGDIGNRSLRYLLLRTERPNIFFGRFLGSVAFLGAALAILFVLLVVYLGLRYGVYSFGDMAWWSLQAYGALLALGLAYTALCAWISSAVDSPGGSSVLCLLATIFPIVFVNMAADALKSKSAGWERLLPWGWKYDLLSHDLGTRMLAYAVMLGFTLLFLFLGARAFRRRDL